jgi:hypothetical protein
MSTKTNGADQVFVIVNVKATMQTADVPTAMQGNWTNALTGESVLFVTEN